MRKFFLLMVLLGFGIVPSAFAVKDTLLLSTYGVEWKMRGFIYAVTSFTVNVGDTLIFGDDFTGTNSFSIVDSVSGTVSANFNGISDNGFFTYIVKSSDVPKFFVEEGAKSLITITVRPLTGIAEVINKMQFMVFPNPASFAVTIKSTEASPFNLQLMNFLGQVVYSHPSISGQDFTFDVGELPKGIYVILLQDLQNNSVGRQKLIVH